MAKLTAILLSTSLLAFSPPECLADQEHQVGLEREGIGIAKELCGDDLGCRYLREGYEEESDPKNRSLQFTALALYVQQTLGPKLPKSPETERKLKLLDEIFTEHLGLVE